MERLSEKLDRIANILGECFDSEEDLDTMLDCVSKLKEIEDAEKQGRLAMSPVFKGQKVWVVEDGHDMFPFKRGVYEVVVCTINFDQRNFYVETCQPKCHYAKMFSFDEVNDKHIFHKKEKAIAEHDARTEKIKNEKCKHCGIDVSTYYSFCWSCGGYLGG